jgi:hypothetical protein
LHEDPARNEPDLDREPVRLTIENVARQIAAELTIERLGSRQGRTDARE